MTRAGWAIRPRARATTVLATLAGIVGATNQGGLVKRILCLIVGHHFAGWTAAGARPGEPLPWARCSRCGVVL